MLRKPFHGWRIKQEIQKLTPIRASSPNLNPVRESPGSPTRPTPLTPLSPSPPLFSDCQNLPHTSHFRFARQSLSTSFLATGPSSASYYSRTPEPEPEPEPNTHLEDPNLNVESLRESSDDRRENCGDGEAFCRGRTLPEERVLILCVVEDGKCRVSCFWTKHNSQVLNKLEVYPGNFCHVAMEEIMKYGGKVMPLPKQVANKLEVHLGRQFRVAYEEAIKYGVQVMMRPFALQATTWEKCAWDTLESLLKPNPEVALCDRKPLREKIAFIRESLAYNKFYRWDGYWDERFGQPRFSRLWRFCVLLLLQWVRSATYFGRKK